MKYVSEFLAKYWFPILMITLAVAIIGAVGTAIEHKAAISKACMVEGKVSVYIDNNYYCIEPGILTPVEVK